MAAILTLLIGLGACEEPTIISALVQSTEKSAAPGAAQAAEPTNGKRLAISHTFTVRLPSSQVEAVQQKHLAECAKLGCIVLNTRLDRQNEGWVNALISVRIAPEAFSAFADFIASPPSIVVVHSETAEDKTLPFLDIEKRLEVKIALRDRLIAMLKDPGAKSAADLASIEKELAEVQGDIEAITAQRDYLRTITETIKVDVNYNGIVASAGGIDFTPLDYSVMGIGRTIVGSAAALVSFLAACIPWVPLIAFLIWGFRRGIRRWRLRKAVATPILKT